MTYTMDRFLQRNDAGRLVDLNESKNTISCSVFGLSKHDKRSLILWRWLPSAPSLDGGLEFKKEKK